MSGNYTLPLPPVVPNTTIEAAWANTTDDDIATALTDSLDRYGRGGMVAPFRLVDGSETAPAWAFASETGTGMWREGAGVMAVSVQGAKVGQWSAAGYTGNLTGASVFTSNVVEPISLHHPSAAISWRANGAEEPPGVVVGRSAGNVLTLRGLGGITLQDATSSLQKLGQFFGPAVAGAINLGSIPLPWGNGYFRGSVTLGSTTTAPGVLAIDGASGAGNGRPLIGFSQGGTRIWNTYMKGNDLSNWYVISVANESIGAFMTPTAQGWVLFSDARLKTNLANITGALAKVAALRAVSFDWLKHPDLPRDVGLLAQEVQEVLPEAVEAGDPERLGLRYHAVIPLLVAAINELNAKVDAL